MRAPWNRNAALWGGFVYRAADGSDELRAALVRNLWRGNEPGDAGLVPVMTEVAALRAALAATPVADLVVADRLDGTQR